MILSRIEPWGQIRYDTKEHRFEWQTQSDELEMPIPSMPLLLNIDLTLKCNMDCVHCVAADMEKTIGSADACELKVTKDLLERVNSSPFLVVVITGGEPLLKHKEADLIKLLSGIKKKGIILDTNGTIIPSDKVIGLLQKKQVLVRVSWDTPVPSEEVKLRKTHPGMYANASEAIKFKELFINKLVVNDIPVAIQTVIHKGNYKSKILLSFPHKLVSLGINRWVLQRFIPSHKMRQHILQPKEALVCMRRLASAAEKIGLKCEYKADLRHNSVFLLVGDGELYTQSNDVPGKKIHLGKIGSVDYFNYVSSVDHAERYLKHTAFKKVAV